MDGYLSYPTFKLVLLRYVQRRWKRSKDETKQKSGWPLKDGPGMADSGPTFQLPPDVTMSPSPIGTQILSQTGLDLYSSVKMFIVCCPGF